MNNVRKTVRALRRSVERSWNLGLSRQENRLVRAIGEGIRTALKRESMFEDKRWIDRIEGLRAELNTSTIDIFINHDMAGVFPAQGR